MQRIRRICATAALKLRRLRLVHKPLRWFRRTFLPSCYEAWLEWLRSICPGAKLFGPPNRVESIYQTLRAGSPKMTGRIILHDQGNPQVTDDCLMVVGGYQQYLEQPWPIFWSRHSKAHLVTDSLALRLEPKCICLESVYGYKRLRGDPAYRFLFLPKAVTLSGNWTSIIARFVPANDELGSCPNYTHWLLDALPRLALLSEFPPDTRILVPARLHKNQLEALRLLGLEERCRLTSERHLELENYFFSSPTSMLQGYNPYGIEFLRRSFLPHRDQAYSGPKKFFVQRLGFSREPGNRIEIENFFEQLGWIPVDIMRLTFAQQVQLFAEAEAIAGMFGSGFTNCVFCRPGCKIFTIMPRDYGVDGFLEWIGQVVGCELHQMVIAGSYDYKFDVDLAAVKSELIARRLL